MTECVDLHIKHKYFVKSVERGPNQIEVSFPQNKILSLPEMVTNYTILDRSVVRVKNSQIRKFTCPNYTSRPLVMADILLDIDLYDMDTGLIVWFDKEERIYPPNGFMDMMTPLYPDNSKKEISQEIGLMKILTSMLLGEFSDVQEDIQKLDIQEGVDILFTLVEGD